ncbi:hypothetical protein NE611_17290, partial [Anaerostipes caccae]|nr:hypothetical protein [Anaerostipes caccae]
IHDRHPDIHEDRIVMPLLGFTEHFHGTKTILGAATIAPDVIEGLIKNDAVTAAVGAFTKDFEGLCGEGKTMKDCC